MNRTFVWPALVTVVALSTLCTVGAAQAAPVAADPFVTVGTGTSPRSVATSATGEVFVAAYGTNEVKAYTAAGVAEPGRSISMGAGQRPIDVAVDSSGAVWTANVAGHSIGWFTPGDAVPVLIDLGVGQEPEAIAVTPGNLAYTVNGLANTVSKSEKRGTVFQTAPVFATLPAGADPVALAVDAAGTIFTANAGTSTVSSVTAAGSVTGVVAQLPAGGAPDAIAVDSQGMLYVAVTNTDSVVKVDPSKPVASSVVATYRLEAGAKPFGLAADARDNVYVTSRATSSVSVIPALASTAAVIQTMPVGSGVSGVAITPGNLLLSTSFARGVVSSLDLNTVIALAKPTPDVAVGAKVSGAFTSTGVDPVTYSSPDFPSWLTLDAATGAFSGTPTAPGSVSFSVRGTSLVSESAPVTVSFTVTGMGPTMPPTQPPTTTAPGGAGGSGSSTGTGGSGGAGSTGGAGGQQTLAHTGSDAMLLFGLAAGALASVVAGVTTQIVRGRRRIG